MLDIEHVKASVEEMYQFKVDTIEKIKNVFKIKSDNRTLCLKTISYDYGHFLFILSAIKHLQQKGFEYIPYIIKTVSQNDFIRIDKYHAYLTDWIDAREADYDNPLDELITAGKLAELHLKSKGFEVTPDMNPRIGWLKWIENYRTRMDEIADFKNRIEAKEKKTEFDCLYIQIFEEEIDRAETAVINLGESEYIYRMEKEIEEHGFCHHDFAYHNVLISDLSKVNIIDFDYCILDSNLHDLGSLLMRCMKNGKWSVQNACFVLDAYSAINTVYETDIPIMAAFLEFPQDYWQIGIQYYWEKQPWEEEFFIKRLQKIIEDRKMRQEFIDEFRLLKYGGR